MANFLTRLVTRHLGLIPVVQPLIASMFASEEVLLGSDSLGFEAQTSSIDSFSEEERNWEAGKTGNWQDGETGRRGDGETEGAEFKADSSRTRTGKMPILQAELSSSGGVGVWHTQALSTSSEIHISKQEDTEILRTGKIPIPRAQTSSSDGLGVSPVQAMDASSSSQPSKLVPSPEQSDSFSEAISAISSEATPIQPTPENQGNRVQPLVELVEEIQPNTFQPLDTNRSPNIHERRSHLATSSEQQDSSPLTEPSSSQTPKVDTPQNPVANFMATPPTQLFAAPGMIQRKVDASMRSHSSIDSPVNPPNLGESGGFVVEDIPLEHPSPVKPTLPLVSPEAIPSVQPTTTSVPSRVEPLFNEVLETGQRREHTQYGSDQTSLTPSYEGRRESSFPHLVGEEQGERLTEPDWDNREVLERDRSTAQPDSQISNLRQRNAPRETQATSSFQASPALEIIQPLRSAESPMSSPIQAPESQSSRRPNSVQDVLNTAPSSKYSTTPQVENQGTIANASTPEPLVRSEIVLPIQPSAESQPSRVEPLINNDVAPSVQPKQQLIESDLNHYHKTVQESINKQQNTSTARPSEQTEGHTQRQMGRRLQEDSSSQAARTVPSRTLSQQQEISTGSNPPLHATAQKREFIQLVPQRLMSGNQSLPISSLPDGETGRRGDGEKKSVGSLTATGDERMSEQSFLLHSNVDDPPKSPLKRGTLSNIVSSLNRETLSSIVSPLNRETLSNIVPPFLRGARGDRVMSSTFEIPSESSRAMQIQVQSEKLSSLIRRSLSVLSESSSSQSRVYPNTNDVPAFPSSNPTYRRNAANFDPTNQLNPVETTPTIQISIGRIEVRASQPPTPPPPTKSAQRGPTQSLQDYLKQRHGGKP
ncbi:hypothetical protein QUA40_01515 [Microcoleus sp. Pol11C3]|uniref:hypothetical protein n=1 Tax=Microcoleus sp. Pol11C3 TaxID=3055390 RepID=UPI002FCFF67C